MTALWSILRPSLFSRRRSRTLQSSWKVLICSLFYFPLLLPLRDVAASFHPHSFVSASFVSPYSRHSKSSPSARHTGPPSSVVVSSTNDGIGHISSSGRTTTNGFIAGPPSETKPNYESIHGPLGPTLDKVFLSVFRTKMAEKVGVDSDLPNDNYQGLMELTSALNSRYSDRQEVQRIAQDVLRALFPSWLPGSFAVMFSKPFPGFSSRLNAWATLMAGTWLMGECELNDCEIDDGNVGKNQGLLVKRCRFLEESGCASVCVNSCKVPTQKFFIEDMGLPLTMTPNYETGECQFSFGLTPTEEGEREATDVPCLMRCPSSGGMRAWHDGAVRGGGGVREGGDGERSEDSSSLSSSRCSLMGG